MHDGFSTKLNHLLILSDGIYTQQRDQSFKMSRIKVNDTKQEILMRKILFTYEFH